jgi:predicted nucleotidyltransferase
MADPRAMAEGFVEELRGAVGPRLRAAALFGSAARGEWIEGVSDVNVLVLLDALDAPLLALAAPAVRHALDAGVTPLLMELEEWRRAADVFGIELADMKDAHTALLGDDPAAGPPVDPAMLRLQAERELRAKLLHLHGGMLVAADDPQRLGQLFALALPSLTTYMRAALRLAQQPVPADSRGVIESTCALIGAEAEPFLAVLDARNTGGALALKLTDPLADRFNTTATRLATYIDAFGR